MPQFDAFLEGLTDEYLACRDRSIGHDWDVDLPFQLSRRLRKGYELIRASRCTRCHARRYEVFEHKGAQGYIVKTKARYEYPEGYTDTGIGRITNTDVWTEQLRRVAPLPMPKKTPAKRGRAQLRAVPDAS
jgi:hypothetical protein